jgi:hypothetical protein
MKTNLARLLQLLFLLLYVDASYAISQERVRHLVSELRHSTSRSEGMRVDSGCQQIHDDYPNFQRAKPKTFRAFGFVLNSSLQFAPTVSIRSFLPQTSSVNPSYHIESIPSRAPPAAE